MRCQWQELLNLLPIWLRQPVDEQGRESLQELRLRIDHRPELVMKNHSVRLNRNVCQDDLNYILNTSTRYSPWTAGSILQGFITASGGHRIGLCGEWIYDGDKLKNIQILTSICIRVAREYAGISKDLSDLTGSVLIIGKPGSGKTTLLRDLICAISDSGNGAVAVLDERRELFPLSNGKYCFHRGIRTDVLSGCKKVAGLDMAIRTLNPQVIALDEITCSEDCEAVSQAAWCGVNILATAHAGSREELFARKVYKPVLEQRVFNTLVILHSDQTWRKEAM